VGFASNARIFFLGLWCHGGFCPRWHFALRCFGRLSSCGAQCDSVWLMCVCSLLFLLIDPSAGSVQAELRVTVTKRSSLHSLPLKTSSSLVPQLASLRSAAPRVEPLVVPPRLYVLLLLFPSLFSGVYAVRAGLRDNGQLGCEERGASLEVFHDF